MGKGKNKLLRLPNGYGSVMKLSGRRSRPYRAAVNPRLVRDDDKKTVHYKYDTLDYFATRSEALQAILEYNSNKYDINLVKLTYGQIFERWIREHMQGSSAPISPRWEGQTRWCFGLTADLHDIPFRELRTSVLKEFLLDHELPSSSINKIIGMWKMMYDWAIQNDIVDKNYASFIKRESRKSEIERIPYSPEEENLLWTAADQGDRIAEITLIYLYSGFRPTELLTLPRSCVNLDLGYFQYGMKNDVSRNRIVPIHSKILPIVKARYEEGYDLLILESVRTGSWGYDSYKNRLYQLCKRIGIQKHYPHDGRHTFISRLDSAGVQKSICLALAGHSGSDTQEKVYIHKTFDELKKAIELI